MGNSGPDERRDVPSAQGQTANGDLASVETPAAGDFDTLFAAIGRSPTLRRIWRDAYGRDYPEEADPFGFVTVTDLRRIGRAGGRAWTGHSRPGLRPWWPGPVGRPEDRCLAGGGRLLRGGD